MKERTLKTKLLTVLLTLCVALSIVPISAFAESGAYAVKFYPGDYGTMTKNDQIPFVYYGIDDDVNKPYYYKLNVSETKLSALPAVSSILYFRIRDMSSPTGQPMLPYTRSAVMLPFLPAPLFPLSNYRTQSP